MRKGALMNQNPNLPFSPRYSSPPPPPNNSQCYDQGQQHPPFIRPLMQQGKQSPRPTSPYQ